MELLAPAGNVTIAKAVLSAGADAVYLGGRLYNARIYAGNLSEEELCDLLDFAHINDKAVYLTLNTLHKNSEMGRQLYDYILPYYLHGLDGVIVQDPGIIRFLHTYFPGLPVHGSTQMTAATKYAAQGLYEMGLTRVVLPRELSLDTMKEIHQATPVELEVFVHGALCYCYSGQCLMSSFLGGRSGNRGACAQPCRLPYDVYNSHDEKLNTKGQHVLSLKDLNYSKHLDKLYEAGVKSLKIEGRMKQIEYAVGVVRQYRALLDGLYQDPSAYSVSKTAEKTLFDLGNRSGFTDSYLKGQKGPDMVTFASPSHEKKDVDVAIPADKKLEVDVFASFKMGEEASLTISCENKSASVTVTGAECQMASKRPVTEEDIKSKIAAFGGTDFEMKSFELELEGEIFYPASALKELRRSAVSKLTGLILENTLRQNPPEFDEEKLKEIYREDPYQGVRNGKLSIRLNDLTGLYAAMDFSYTQRIYIDAYVLALDSNIEYICETINKCGYQGEIFCVLPDVLTSKALKLLDDKIEMIADFCNGFYIRSLDEIFYLKSKGIDIDSSIIDGRLYAYNDSAEAFYRELGVNYFSAPYELTLKECFHLSNKQLEMPVYGRAPLMVSQGCTMKNTTSCTGKPEILSLKDRKKMTFKVINLCAYCYNIIYNSVPTYLMDEMANMPDGYSFRVEFTDESEADIESVLKLYADIITGASARPDFEYTRGHAHKGMIS